MLVLTNLNWDGFDRDEILIVKTFSALSRKVFQTLYKILFEQIHIPSLLWNVSKASIAFFCHIFKYDDFIPHCGQQQTTFSCKLWRLVKIWKLFIFSHLSKFLFTTKTGNGKFYGFVQKIMSFHTWMCGKCLFSNM